MKKTFRTICFIVSLVSSTILNGQIKQFKEKNNIDYILLSVGKTHPAWSEPIDLSNTYALSLRKNVYHGLGIEGLIGMNVCNNDRWKRLKNYGTDVVGSAVCNDIGSGGGMSASEGIMYGFFIDFAFRDKSREYAVIPKIGLFSTPGVGLDPRYFRDDARIDYCSLEPYNFRYTTVAFSLDVKIKKLILGFSTDYRLEIYKFHLGYVFNDKLF